MPRDGEFFAKPTDDEVADDELRDDVPRDDVLFERARWMALFVAVW